MLLLKYTAINSNNKHKKENQKTKLDKNGEFYTLLKIRD